jgi:hypothetical protein
MPLNRYTNDENAQVIRIARKTIAANSKLPMALKKMIRSIFKVVYICCMYLKIVPAPVQVRKIAVRDTGQWFSGIVFVMYVRAFV